MTAAIGDISDLLDRVASSGYFTHYFLECGKLDVPEPLLRLEFAPDGKRVFDLASMTKALVTSPLIYKLVDDLQLSLESRLGDFMAIDKPYSNLNLRDLLSHRSGLPAWWNFWMDRTDSWSTVSENSLDRHQQIERVLRRHSKSLAGGQEVYSDIGFIILGYLLERHYHQPLESLFEAFIVNPLELHGAYFMGGASSQKSEIGGFVSTGICQLRGRTLAGEVHDENAFALGGLAGHAGLFGTGCGISRYIRTANKLGFWQRLINDNLLIESQDDPKTGTSLGLRRGLGPSAIDFGNGRALGHFGFTGTAFWIDFFSRSYVVFLTNRVISGRRSAEISAIRKQVFAHCYRFLNR